MVGRLLSVVGLLVVVGAVIGLLVSGTGTSTPKASANTIGAYLGQHVPPGTPVGVFGDVGTFVPAAYPVVHITSVAEPAVATLRYAVAPDPVDSAGTLTASYVRSHASLLARQSGRVALWAMEAAAVTTTVAPTTTVTPVPATTVAAPATTTVAAPATTVAPAATVAPATTVTPTPVAAPAPPAPTAAAPTVGVQAGQSFWSIAAQVQQQRLGTAPTTAQVAQYWAKLVAANTSRLPVPGHPDLIYAGQTIVLPAG